MESKTKLKENKKLNARFFYISFLVLLSISCIFIMIYLSSQNGSDTADTSIRVTEWVSSNFGKQNLTEDEFTILHMQIRKIAHVLLYFSAGALAGLWVQVGKAHTTRILLLSVMGIAIVILGFLDEWLKQYIPGRHYQFSEFLLNAVSGLMGLFLVCGIAILIRGIMYLIKKQ